MPENPSAARDSASSDTTGASGRIEDDAGPAVRCDVTFLGGSRWLRREADVLLGEGVTAEIVARSAARQAETDLRSAGGPAAPPGSDADIEPVLRSYEGKGYGSFKILEHDREAGWLLVEGRGAFEARAHIRGGGLTDYATCDIVRGSILGAYRFLQRQAKFPAEGLTAVEVSCAARGDAACRFAVGAPDVLRAHGVEPVTVTLTSRHELEEMLRKSREAEAGLSSFLQEMPFGVVRFDAEGRITFANHKTLEMLGLPLHAAAGRHFAEFLHPDDRDLVGEGFRRVVEGRADPYPIPCRAVSADGTARPVAVDAFPVVDQRGRPAGYQGIVIDLEDRERLGVPGFRFREGLRAAPRAYLEVDPGGSVRHANPAALELLGIASDDAEGAPFERVFAGGSAPEASGAFTEVAAGRSGYAEGRWEVERPGGDRRVLRFEFLADGLATGRIERVLVLAEEVPAGDGQERPADGSWMRALIEHGASVYAVVDAEGKTLYESPSLERVYGWKPEEIVGKSIFDLVHPDDIDLATQKFGEVLKDPGVPKSVEIRYRHKDGSWRTIEVSGVNLLDDEGVGGVVLTSHDVTERRRAEAALQASEARYRTLFDAAPVGIGMADMRGGVVAANRQMQEMNGYTLEEFQAIDLADTYVDRADRKRLLEILVRSGKVRDFQTRLKRKDGTVYDAVVGVDLVVLDGRQTLLTSVRDVTTARRADEALREAEERWRSLAGSSTDVIMTVDRDGRIAYINHTVSGFDTAETVGTSIYDYIDASSHDRVKDVIDRVFATGEPGSCEITGAGPDARESRYDTRVLPVGREGELVAAMLVASDVTERRRAEEALRESEELHRTLMNALPNAVTMTDLEGRITYVSQRALELHGADAPEDLVGRSSFDLIAPENRQLAAANLLKTLEKGALRGLEYALLRKDGSRFPGELSAAVVPDARGKPKGFVAITRDLTEYKRAEEALREAEGEREELAFEVAALRSELQGRYGPDSIIGQDPKMRAIYDTILAVGPTNATVLIQGDTGTGKELVAKAVHYNSTRRDKAFVKVDCGALAETLLESELFGHVKGAFTGAVRERAGRFELAHEGTVFLDEVQNLSIPLQAKLLRVVQEGRFEKVGGTKTIDVDVRIVAATNEDLGRLVGRREFRKDLYYRLNVIPIRLPPLAERRGDVPLLVRSFVERFAQRHAKAVTDVSQQALDKLMAYDWPGNVRELENIVEQAVVFSRGRTIEADEIRLPDLDADRGSGFWAAVTSRPLRKALEGPEKKILIDALARTNGNKKKAAELLGISRSAFYEKLKRLGISRER